MGAFHEFFSGLNKHCGDKIKIKIDSDKSYSDAFVIKSDIAEIYINKYEIPRIIEHLKKIDNWCDNSISWSNRMSSEEGKGEER